MRPDDGSADDVIPTLDSFDSMVLASSQVREAKADLDIDPARIVCWPYPELDAVTGPLGAGGDVWFVAAFSGGGKTTFIGSAIEAWRQQGKRVYVMPLETQPKRFRTLMACMAIGVHPGDALSKRLRLMGEEGERKRQLIARELERQETRPYIDQVRVDPVSAIDVAGLTRGLKNAKGWGADIVIIDHIDHIEGGDGTNLAAESRKVNHTALKMAQANDMLLVFTSQLNMDVVRDRNDKLAKYQPPQVNHLWLPGVKLHVATGMVGLFRRIRDPRPDESLDEYKAALADARSGRTEPTTALDPTVMGTVAMKLRNYGQNEGKRAFLHYERGRVSGMAEKDQYTTGGHTPRKVS